MRVKTTEAQCVRMRRSDRWKKNAMVIGVTRLQKPHDQKIRVIVRLPNGKDMIHDETFWNEDEVWDTLGAQLSVFKSKLERLVRTPVEGFQRVEDRVNEWFETDGAVDRWRNTSD